MFQLTIGTNTNRKTIVCRKDSTPRQAMKEANINYDNGIIYFEGNTLDHGALDKTFGELGVAEEAVLNVVVKLENA